MAGSEELQEPPAALCESVTFAFGQTLISPVIASEGKPTTSMDLLEIAFEQPPAPVKVYLMVVEPANTGVISPVEASTVAIASSSLDHTPPASPFDVKVAVALIQTESDPLNVPAFGAVVTVTVLVAVSFAQPPVPVTTYLIVDVPADTPVINPELALMVATPVLVELHAPPVSPSVVKVTVPSEHNA